MFFQLFCIFYCITDFFICIAPQYPAYSSRCSLILGCIFICPQIFTHESDYRSVTVIPLRTQILKMHDQPCLKHQVGIIKYILIVRFEHKIHNLLDVSRRITIKHQMLFIIKVLTRIYIICKKLFCVIIYSPCIPFGIDRLYHYIRILYMKIVLQIYFKVH